MNDPLTICANTASVSNEGFGEPSQATLPLFDAIDGIDWESAGQRAYQLVAELFPICRSITGNGVRQTLRRLERDIPVSLLEVPTGTEVFDWTIPDEWNIQGATIRNMAGETIVDFAEHNLHVVNYSSPISKRMPWRELRQHIHTLPEQPDAIPYRTSYYERTWGFCIPDRLARQLDTEPEAEYEVNIDASLQPGSLSLGECVIPGETSDEFLLSAHCCHPSLANDNLSGLAVAVEIARWLRTRSRRYTYRLVFAPGTIGALSWLHQRQECWPRVRHGLVLSLLGDHHPPQYKRSRHHNAEIDEVADYVTKSMFPASSVVPFTPLGYDERQFGSPGINLPVGRVCRSEFGTFPEYHTSGDDLQFVSPAALGTSIAWITHIIDRVESNRTYRSLSPFGEPHLAKHLRRENLQASSGGSTIKAPSSLDREAVSWVMNYSDGKHSLLEIAQRSGLSFSRLATTADRLLALNLLEVKEPTMSLADDRNRCRSTTPCSDKATG